MSVAKFPHLNSSVQAVPELLPWSYSVPSNQKYGSPCGSFIHNNEAYQNYGMPFMYPAACDHPVCWKYAHSECTDYRESFLEMCPEEHANLKAPSFCLFSEEYETETCVDRAPYAFWNSVEGLHYRVPPLPNMQEANTQHYPQHIIDAQNQQQQETSYRQQQRTLTSHDQPCTTRTQHEQRQQQSLNQTREICIQSDNYPQKVVDINRKVVSVLRQKNPDQGNFEIPPQPYCGAEQQSKRTLSQTFTNYNRDVQYPRSNILHKEAVFHSDSNFNQQDCRLYNEKPQPTSAQQVYPNASSFGVNHAPKENSALHLPRETPLWRPSHYGSHHVAALSEQRKHKNKRTYPQRTQPKMPPNGYAVLCKQRNHENAVSTSPKVHSNHETLFGNQMRNSNAVTTLPIQALPKGNAAICEQGRTTSVVYQRPEVARAVHNLPEIREHSLGEPNLQRPFQVPVQYSHNETCPDLRFPHHDGEDLPNINSHLRSPSIDVVSYDKHISKEKIIVQHAQKPQVLSTDKEFVSQEWNKTFSGKQTPRQCVHQITLQSNIGEKQDSKTPDDVSASPDNTVDKGCYEQFNLQKQVVPTEPENENLLKFLINSGKCESQVRKPIDVVPNFKITNMENPATTIERKDQSQSQIWHKKVKFEYSNPTMRVRETVMGKIEKRVVRKIRKIKDGKTKGTQTKYRRRLSEKLDEKFNKHTIGCKESLGIMEISTKEEPKLNKREPYQKHNAYKYTENASTNKVHLLKATSIKVKGEPEYDMGNYSNESLLEVTSRKGKRESNIEHSVKVSPETQLRAFIKNLVGDVSEDLISRAIIVLRNEENLTKTANEIFDLLKSLLCL